MKTSSSSLPSNWWLYISIGYGYYYLSSINCCVAYYCPPNYLSSIRSSVRLLPENNCNAFMDKRCSSSRLQISTIDVESSTNNSAADGIDYVTSGSDSQSVTQGDGDNLLQWKDIVPISLYTTICIAGAILISTYEDFDVTHTRPNPSTLRLPTTSRTSSSSSGSGGITSGFQFFGAATKGMGWGPANRGIGDENSIDTNDASSTSSFEEWYGTSATTLQWKPSYNEIMLQHRSERIPRWERFETLSTTSTPLSTTKSNSVITSKDQLQQAILQLYKSLDELDELKTMADDYDWEGMKEHLRPTKNTLASDVSTSKREYALPMAMEYSMDVLKSMPSSYYVNSPNTGNTGGVSELIGFDWGSCAWRHCGAKADAQEAIAELYNNVGMLEPFECQFIIDIVERSIRDVLAVVPDDIKQGVSMQTKPYVPYVPRAGDDEEGLGIDYEYTQALSELRIDLSNEE